MKRFDLTPPQLCRHDVLPTSHPARFIERGKGGGPDRGGGGTWLLKVGSERAGTADVGDCGRAQI